MSKNSINLSEGKKIFKSFILNPRNIPCRFTYDGEEFTGLGTGNKGTVLFPRKIVEKNEKGVKVSVTAKLDRNMRVRAEAFYNEEFGESEYTLFFENVGKGKSKELKDVYCFDRDFTGKKPVLRSIMGDHDNWYAGYEQDLTKADKYFLSTGGRATHIVFPYFNLAYGNGGMLMAFGWAGTWEGLFSYTGDNTHVKYKSCIQLNAVLLPGESVRTALVVQLPYKGRDYDDSTNLWREWYMKYNLPKADGEGNDLKPFTTTFWAGDTGLPNSDGSISERYFTWKPTLDKLVEENVVSDFRWFDAGWYSDPKGNTVESDWWGTIGSWELDKEKWPGKTFLESNEACHKLGMKVLMWFEPERTTDVESLAKNYGYNPEWGIGEGNVRTNNLGNDECLKWTLNRIIKVMDENGIDFYREDNNSDPGYAWPYLDNKETSEYKIPRWGVNENKCIVGHYKLWDGIIDYCRKNGKCTFVDSCASGGGRNDIESMRRGFPLMRSDYDRTSSSMRLSQSSTFTRWIPFHGSSVKETVGQLDNIAGKGTSPYVNRASYLPIYNYQAAFVHNKELDYDILRNNINEWKTVRHLLTRDMYYLTPWHHEFDKRGFTAFAYDAPELKESIALIFRMEDCEEKTFEVRLQFAVAGALYTVEDEDTGESFTCDGEKLKKGFKVELKEKKTSKLLRINRK